MEFTEIKYAKTVEGNFNVQLINNNTVVATIVFPTDELAGEYVEFKQKLKSDTDKLLAKLKGGSKVAETVVKDFIGGKVAEAPVVVPVVKATEVKTETVGAKVENAFEQVVKTVERQKPIDASAKVSGDANKVIDTTAKAAKSPDGDWQESAKAKVVFSE